jgi:hypothetical protein
MIPVFAVWKNGTTSVAQNEKIKEHAHDQMREQRLVTLETKSKVSSSNAEHTLFSPNSNTGMTHA